jgi:hypothetical protein
MIESIQEDSHGTLILKISNQQVEKELPGITHLIVQHLANGKGFDLQVGERIQLSVVPKDYSKRDITVQIKILSITQRGMSIESVTRVTTVGTHLTILDIYNEWIAPVMDRHIMPPKSLQPDSW